MVRVACFCTILLLAGVVLLWGADDSSADIASAARAVRQIVAHRGSSADCPENTLAAYHRAIEAGATAIEIDLRTTLDGHLVSLHDANLERSTNGSGPVSGVTLAELRKLDAGSHFSPKFRHERVPTFREVLELCRGRIDILLDLKETGGEYAQKVIADVRRYGEPARIIVGVRTLAHARFFRQHLPGARQLGLIPDPESIEAFAAAGVETIRLWPHWLGNERVISRVRGAGAKLHLNGSTGEQTEVLKLLRHRPESISSDDPARLVATLRSLASLPGRNGSN